MLKIIPVLLLAACTPAMYHPTKSQDEANFDAEYCRSHAMAYARPGIEPRIAAYKACMMEKGYRTY